MNRFDEMYVKALAKNTPKSVEEMEARKELAQKNINETLSFIFAEMPKLKLIRVRGWTPSFNDGDPCTHSQCVAVDVYDPNDLFEEFFLEDENEFEDEDNSSIKSLLTGERLEWSHYLWNDTLNKREENKLPDDPHHAACVKAVEIVDALSDDFEFLYDTNFTVDFVRDADEELGFCTNADDYDPDY